MNIFSSLLVLAIALAAASTVEGASNSTDYYTEPEEISDSVPVAITIIIILVILLLIFLIILLLMCIKLCARGSRSKDIEDQTVMTTYRNDSPRRHSKETRHDPVGRQTPPPARDETPPPARQDTPPRNGSTVVYVSPSSEPKKNQLPPISMPGHACQCRECLDLRQDRTTTSHR